MIGSPPWRRLASGDDTGNTNDSSPNTGGESANPATNPKAKTTPWPTRSKTTVGVPRRAAAHLP